MMYTMNMKPAHFPRPMPSIFGDPFFRSMMGMEPPRRPLGMRVDMHETEEAYILEAMLPGVAPADIELTVENDVLTIAAEMKRRHGGPCEGGPERRCGHVERSFSLEGIRQEDVSAACENGILTVTLPKQLPEAGKEKRRIAIQAAASAPALEAPAEA